MTTPRGFVLWFTGLSGSGKSTLASMAAAELRRRGLHVETLDGDEIRKRLSRGLGFSREDRDENVRRIGFAAALVSRSGACAIAAAISPYRAVRDEVRNSVERFVEVYTECPLDVLAERDPKGLYKKALAGTIKNFTGIDDPYEAPHAAEVHLHTDRESPEASLAKILSRLEALGLLEVGTGGGGRGLQRPHGHELVDRVAEGEPLSDAGAKKSGELELDDAAYRDFLSIASGAFSPLRGFMTSKDHRRVVREMRLEQGLPWSLPVTLAVPESRAPALEPGRVVALGYGGRAVGALHVDDVFRPDREEEAERVFGTTDRTDARVVRFLSRGPVYVGGEIRCLERPNAVDERDAPSPRSVRAELELLSQSHVTAIRTDWPPLAADEHVVRAALEFSDAVIVLSGAGTAGIPPRVNVRCYEALFEKYFAPGKCRALSYPWPADATEPRRLVADAIVAKNYGASRLVVVGRMLDASSDRARAELGIEIVAASDSVRSPAIGVATAKTAPTGATWLDRAAILESVRQGSADPDLVRPEVAAVLRDYFDESL